MLRIKQGAALLVSAALGLGAAARSQSAADMAAMPRKAPPVTPFVLDVHGFLDVTFKNTSVTPRGLMVREYSGLTTQVANGLAIDVYKIRRASSTAFRSTPAPGTTSGRSNTIRASAAGRSSTGGSA